jgi:hypothetical protein
MADLTFAQQKELKHMELEQKTNDLKARLDHEYRMAQLQHNTLRLTGAGLMELARLVEKSDRKERKARTALTFAQAEQAKADAVAQELRNKRIEKILRDDPDWDDEREPDEEDGDYDEEDIRY